MTRDGGKTWTDVTPPELDALGQGVAASTRRTSTRDTAYAAVNTLPARRPAAAHLPHARRRQDLDAHRRPGIPDGGIVNAVREDPKRRGLLFAGTEQAVYVSFDDGDHWQSLRLNMPATSIRDLVVKDDDLVVGHARARRSGSSTTSRRCGSSTRGASRRGRAPVRAAGGATRVRWNKNTDTPLPPGRAGGAEPAGRRDHRLLPEGRREARHARGARRTSKVGSRVVEPHLDIGDHKRGISRRVGKSVRRLNVG